MKWIDLKTAKTSLALAWPISLQSILVNLLSMIDVFMVSHLGDAAVGAVGLGTRYQFMLMVILLGIAWTVGVLSAQYYGAGKTEKIRSTLAMGCGLACTALTPIILLTLFFSDTIVGFGSTQADVISQGSAYLCYTVPSLLFIAFILPFENAIRSLGYVQTPMVLNVVAISINVILNYWFINGGLGVPELGVTGAAIATALARCIQFGLVLCIIFRKGHILRPRRTDLADLLDRTQVRYFLRLATPMMFGFGVWSVGIFVYQLIYGRMSTEALSVMSLLAPVEGFYLSIFFGIASACSIMIGRHLGANEFEEAKACARTYAIANPLFAFMVGASLLLFKEQFFMPFSDLPVATLDSAKTIFTLISLSIWIKVTNMTMAMGVLRAGGDNTICVYIDALSMWVISIPLTLIAAFYFKWPLLYVVMVVYSEEIVKVFMFAYRVKQKKWLKNLTVSTEKSNLVKP